MGNNAVGSIIDRRDFDFQLLEVLDLPTLIGRKAYGGHDLDTVAATLDLAERLANDDFAPCYRKSDLVEPQVIDGKVALIPEIGAALTKFNAAGFMSASVPFEEGGMQLPWTIVQSCYAMFQAANIGATIYYFLTVSAANVLRKFGTQEQQALFMRPMLEGRFHGTMVLSEPQAGSSLADMRTRATPLDDGTYRIIGNKMWISGGEHELGENIVHLVLAKIDGGPKGTRGISLFIVPKKLVDADGNVGADNNVELIGLNHKMGYRAATNTALNFGGKGDTIGYLVGAPHQGLAAMFVMMNEARISVGCGATMLGYAGYLHSLAYAKERLQGRHPDQRDPDQPPVPLADHADIRRMLLLQKSYVEGAFALCMYAAYLVDEEVSAPEEEARESARKLLAILTPIVKSWPSEFCLDANKQAMQVLGGSGYTIDYPIEQYYRDNRLNLIHEGTNGIQAIDLVGRKLGIEDGALWAALLAAIRADVDTARSHPAVAACAAQLDEVVDRVEAVTATLLAEGRDSVRLMLANATLYLDMIGHVCVAWMWIRQATVAATALAEGASGDKADFYRGKVLACDFFHRYELGRVDHWLPIIARMDDLTVELDVACL